MDKIALILKVISIAVLSYFAFSIFIFVYKTGGFDGIKNNTLTKSKRNPKTNIEVKKNSYNLGESIVLYFSVENESTTNFNFCYWQTPLEKTFTANFLEIVFDGNTIPYKGRMLKRTPPNEDDFITLKSKESIAQEIDITTAYELDKIGEYQIKFIGRSINQLPSSNTITIKIK